MLNGRQALASVTSDEIPTLTLRSIVQVKLLTFSVMVSLLYHRNKMVLSHRVM